MYPVCTITLSKGISLTTPENSSVLKGKTFQEFYKVKACEMRFYC